MQTQLNAIADSAVLAAVDPLMLCQSSAVANAAATSMFTAQASVLQGIGSITPTVTINPPNAAAGCAGSLRMVTDGVVAALPRRHRNVPR